jgi:diguanylate cyclase (GGDEF)-like protein/PAS domain S-box-containing protein
VTLGQVDAAVKTLLASIVQSSDDAVIGETPDGAIASWNPGAERLYGYSADEVIGRQASILHPRERLAEENAMLEQALRGERVEHRDTQRLRKDGRRVDVGLSVSPILDSSGAIVGVSAIEHDITERKRVAGAARDAEAYLESAFHDAPIPMALVSIAAEDAGRFLQANQAFCELTGRAPEELRAGDLQSITHPDDLPDDLASMAELIAGEIPGYQLEERMIHRDRHPVWVLLSASLVRDASGKPLHCIRQMQDIQERKRFEGQLEYLADHDPLTGLVNRRRFARDVAHQIAYVRRYSGGGAVLMIDLDNLKYVNDTLGHNAGDEVITAAARILHDRLRETDLLARLGGDEFAVLIPRATEAEARAVGSGLLEAVRENPLLVGVEGQPRVTISVGLAIFDAERETTAEDLLIEADVAMYEAKNAGRDRLALATTEQQVRMEARLSGAERIRRALDEGGFVLHCQPIVDLGTDTVAQYELLLRMAGDDGELIMPATFLYTAERFDLIGAIDRWVIARGVGVIAAEAKAGRDLRLEINLSGRSVTDPELPGFIERELSSASIDPANVIFEVTETAAIAHMDRARRFVARVTDMGCGFALDDFGAGFGSFYYLKHLPLDYLKIDGEFVSNLPASKTDQLILGSIVDMSKGLGKTTIAEFVGDDETVDLLREQGVEYGQGYHLGEPRPLSEITTTAAA